MGLLKWNIFFKFYFYFNEIKLIMLILVYVFSRNILYIYNILSGKLNCDIFWLFSIIMVLIKIIIIEVIKILVFE